jgi:hypothetical protein
MRWRFTGVGADDRLTGEMALEPTDRKGAPPQPFTARRQHP